MAKLFGNLTRDGLEDGGDRVGGFSVQESGIYDAVVKMAFAGASQHGAQFVEVHLDLEGGGQHRERIFVTNRKGENFYPDKKDPNKKHQLPGFTSIDDLCLVTTGFGLADQDTEEKVVNLWDSEAKKETPQNVPALMDMVGKPVTIALLKCIVDKTQKNEATGIYEPTGETREENEIDKFFHKETGRTVTEIRNEVSEPIFKGKWAEKNTGKDRNKAKGKKEGAPGMPGGGKTPPLMNGAAGGSAPAPKSSLFG